MDDDIRIRFALLRDEMAARHLAESKALDRAEDEAVAEAARSVA